MTTWTTTELLPLTARRAWKALEVHHKKIHGLHLRALFGDDPKRGERLTAEGTGIFLDYSKNRVTDETIALLCRLAEASRLSIDAVQRAKSGHPGTPMALAPLLYTLWNRVMRFDPEDPIWPNRDRFVLSNGHASMLLWSVLHLTETRAVNADYERLGHPAVSLDDIRRFRQIDSTMVRGPLNRR